jgi:hypothetical protein
MSPDENIAVVSLSKDGVNWKPYPLTTLDARLTVTAFKNIRSGESRNAPIYKEKVDYALREFSAIAQRLGLSERQFHIKVEDAQSALDNCLYGWHLLVDGAGMLHNVVKQSQAGEKQNRFENALVSIRNTAESFSL